MNNRKLPGEKVMKPSDYRVRPQEVRLNQQAAEHGFWYERESWKPDQVDWERRLRAWNRISEGGLS